MRLKLLTNCVEDVILHPAPSLQPLLCRHTMTDNTCRPALSGHDPDNSIPPTPGTVP